MLCRNFKSPRINRQELKGNSWGEAWAFNLKKEAHINGRLFGVLSSIKDIFVKRWPSRVEVIQHSFPVLLFCFCTFGQAQNLNPAQMALPSKETELQKINLSTTNGAVQLQMDAKNWLTQMLKLNPEQVQISDMDARLKVQPCLSGVSFDHPFANRQVVRARCENPNWQFFLRATLSEEQSASNSLKTLPSNGPTQTAAPSKPINSLSVQSAKPPTSFNPVVPAGQSNFGTKIKTVLVAIQPLRRGTILQASFFKQVDLNIPNTDTMVLSQFKEIENTELLHDMGADQAIRNYDIKPTLLVKRGQQVNFSVGEGRGFLITIKTEAQQDGSLGDQIKLKNVESGRLISGVITGLNEARAL